MEVRRRRTKTSSSATAPQLLAKLDVFPKIDSEYTTKSRSGGGLAILTFFFIVFMVLLEIVYFMDTHMEYDYAVNFETSPKIELNLDITVAMPCGMIDADVYDHLSQTPFSGESFPSNPATFQMSEEQAKFHAILNRAREEKLGAGSSIEELLFKNAKALGSGLMHVPIFSSDDNSKSNACRFNGTLVVNRHAGTLHVIMGKQINLGIGGNFHAHIQFGGGNVPLNFSHRIDHLSFGSVKMPYFGSLDNEMKITNESTQEYQYTITVVPLSVDSYRAKLNTYQLSVQEKQRLISHQHGSHGQPGIFFKYDFAPLKIIAKEKHKPLFDLLVRLVGIVGGSFSLSTFFFFVFDFVTCKIFSNSGQDVVASSITDKNNAAASKIGNIQNGHNAAASVEASPNALYIPTNAHISNYVYPVADRSEDSKYNISGQKNQ